VALRQPHDVILSDPDTFYRELLHAAHALKILEAFKRNLRAACHELKEQADLTRVHRRQNLPEPNNLRVVHRVMVQMSVLLQVSD
jgi:hypothetical protein